MKKIIIVGGVAGGASAAARLRRLDEEAKIIIFEKSAYVSYANCGLPYNVGGVINDEDDLLIQNPQSFYDRFRIDVRINSEVIALDSQNKKVKIKNEDDTYDESYDYLILAPGSKARKMYENEEKLGHLKTVEDLHQVKKHLENAKRIAIIGGGFIGIELAENLIKIQKEVSIFEYADHIMPNLDDDIVYYLERELGRNNIDLRLRARISNIEIKDDKYIIHLNDEMQEFDYVIVAAGVMPNTEFLESSGIALNERGFIITDEYLRTNLDNVYACGDAIINKNYITGNSDVIALAGPANRQGRIIADNIYGLKNKYDGSIGTSIIKLFSLSAASTGLNTKRLDAMKYDYETIRVHPYSHATYYPNAKIMHAKLFYDLKTLKILGFQAVGKDGIDKFTDVIATAIKLNAKVTDLSRLELAYAPAYLSAKSPANYLGFIAENIINGLEEFVSVDEALKDGNIILDVRDEDEYALGHIENSINIPVDELRDRLDKLSRYQDSIIDVYCEVGIRAHIAARILKAKGYKVRNISGAYLSYKAQ